MNKCQLVGRLVKDPEIKFAQGTGNAVTKFTVAVNRKYKKEGQPDADFLPVVVFGKTAEAVEKYTAKGKLVSIVGVIQTSNYENKDSVRVYKTEIIADEVNFLEWKDKEGQGNQNNSSSNNDFSSASDITPIDDGDIPF
jgi:single-strand DNA-binding protein